MNHNIVKGLLILLVAIDHNDFARDVIPGFLRGLSFHVVAFMALPFIRPALPLNTAAIRKHFFRLYYPFFVFACVTAGGYWLSTGRPFGDALVDLLHALYSANVVSLKAATNMALLWFLPSLFSLLIVKGMIEGAARPLKLFLVVAVLVCHPLIGAASGLTQHYLPLGLLPAVYIVPLVYVIAFLHLKTFEPMPRKIAFLVSALLFAGVKHAQIQLGLSQEVGFVLVSDYRSPLALLVNDLEAITGTLLVFQMSRFHLGSFCESLGKFSLQVYLFHAFIGAALFVTIKRMPIAIDLTVALAVSVLLTLWASMLVARGVFGTKHLKSALFPEDGREVFWTARRFS
jgi:fucose 4-O-acetylase-like acetyltransferase